ncbi:hypothetical protein [Pseudoalteromonas rhizosphaerae]|uniref:hypothetical protein n=1 Tax=Pseudoalteromonas rhizosphaerae TaxID=2518973 RepID=UPI00384A6EBA
MESTFDVSGKKFRVVFSLLGFEKYYYDGQLLLSRWSFKFKDRLSFEVGNDVVEINVVLSHKSFSTQAIINGGLVVTELFPEFKAQLQAPRKGLDYKGMLTNLVMWFVIAFVFMLIFQWLQQP